jgi:anti-anti-sigma factor
MVDGEWIDSHRLEADFVPIGQGAIVRCAGQLDASTQDVLLQRIARAMSRGRIYVLLDLSGLSFSDRTILGVLDAAETIASRRGVKLELLAGDAVRRILEALEDDDG